MKKVLCFLGMLVVCAGMIFAQDDSQRFKGWKQAKTEHFTFVYEDAQKEAAEGFVQIADNAWNKVAKIYSIPKENIRVYVTGRTNIVNALTYFSPVEIGMFTNPLNMIDFTFRANWQELFFTHELIHAANCTFEDKSKIGNYLFGDFATSLDFQYVNGWALEGLTTVLETELTDGGRGRSPYFELEYKALTMDNGFIPYENVGLEKEPPYGQSYVIGYLIMRSIADRWGIEALADIERNREWLGSWENAVTLVTGETPQDIYRDLRIALAKKYNKERTIPEGVIISPRELNTCYYKPAIVLDDGTLITMRSAQNTENSIVKLNPAAKKGRNYIQDHKENDLNTFYKETVLFTGNFPSTDCVTADENENVYVISANQRNDRAPGLEMEMALYKWNEENGLKQLSHNISLFHPAVSRNGKTLVATQQKGMQLRLVQVDVNSGEISVISEHSDKSYLFPAVNNDGTKVAALEVDNQRARVIVFNLSDNSFEYVANNDEQIYDPGYLNWTNNDTLIYACNYRGRIEAFEAVKDENGSWKYTPVVADPVGATWAYKNDFAIFYTTKASSGDVIKIKPVTEWGVVPDFEGPSAAGQKICFGALETDYPDFKPYKPLSKIEASEGTKPVKQKEIKHRSEENQKKAEAANSAITEITDEKLFVPLPSPLLYFPVVGALDNSINKQTEPGFGIVTVGLLPKLQMSTGMVCMDFIYYPSMGNFEGGLLGMIPVFNSEIDFLVSHSLIFDDEQFKDVTDVEIGLIKPFIHRYKNRNEINLSLLTSASYSLLRTSTETTNISGDFTSKNGSFFQLGLDFFYNLEKPKRSDISFELIGLGVGYYNFTDNKLYFGGEAETNVKANMNFIGAKLSAAARYTPFPATITPSYSGVTYGGKSLNCSNAGYIIPRVEFVFNQIILQAFDILTFAETKVTFNDFNSFKLEDTKAIGAEAGFTQGAMNLAFGTSWIFENQNKPDFNFYFTIKYGWIRN